MITEDEHHKEVYAHFGLAIYLAQCIEYGIVNAISLYDLIPNRRQMFTDKTIWSNEVDRFFDEKFDLTMGQLIRILEQKKNLPSELSRSLAQSLKLRNTLIHSFFCNRIMLMATESGRNDLINELSAAQELFIRTDKMIEKEIEPVMRQYGITQEMVEKHLAEMRFLFHAEKDFSDKN